MAQTHSDSEKAYLESLEVHFQSVGWPNPERPLWIIVADSHSDLNAYREVLRQATLMRDLVRDHYGKAYQIPLRVLHIGDASDGVNLQEVAETAKLPGEFGIPRRDRYMTPGNSEWRGYTIFEKVEEAEWRRLTTATILQHSRIVKKNKKSDEVKAMPDDELGYLELWPGTEIALSHKPVHELMRDPAHPESSASPAAWRNINFRNWIGAPIVFFGAYVPGVLAAVTIIPNLVPIRANAKVLVTDVLARPLWGLVQRGYHRVRGRTSEEGYVPPEMFKKTGQWFLKDERGFSRRFIERLKALPSWDPETFATMRYDWPVKTTVPAIFHAHTHRGHESLVSVRNTSTGDREIKRVIGVPPTFLDQNVPEPGRGWVSIFESDGVARTAFHDATTGGQISLSIPLDPEGDPRIQEYYDKHGVNMSFPGAIPAGPLACSRMMSKVVGDGTKTPAHRFQIQRMESALQGTPSKP